MSPYSADYRQPLTDFERRAGVVHPAPVNLTRATGRKSLRRPGMPETLRMVEVSRQSQSIGEFLEWLAGESGYVLAQYDENERLWPHFPAIEKLLALYFGIDLERVERERRRLLAYVRTKGDA